MQINTECQPWMFRMLHTNELLYIQGMIIQFYKTNLKIVHCRGQGDSLSYTRAYALSVGSQGSIFGTIWFPEH